MAQASQIAGRKGGSSTPKTPIEAPDSLRSVATAKVLLALGEGEFEGRLTGQNIFLDGTPLVAADGSQNFPGVKWEFRSGSQYQDYIPGIPDVENELGVGVELKSDTPWVRSVINPQLSAVRVRLSWPGLQQQKENGDIVGYRIEYVIEVSTDGGPYAVIHNGAVDGKSSSKYERTHRVDLPEASTGWQVRVRRLTPNRNTNKIADGMRVEAITEVIDVKMRYPNTALLYIEYDASQFSSIPQTSCELYGRVIQVPSNYDPLTRTYSGIWDGTFKPAWSDNPAWINYDIILHKRFGLGKRIAPWQVDKWELYRIAQYCDQLVPDGRGGMEPRHKCDIYIQSRAEAWNVLRDLAAIYRGMTYWARSQMTVMADMPRPVDFSYTRANVVDGRFVYGSTSERARFSRVLVGFDNPDKAYDSDLTVVADQKLLRRYGDHPTEVTAIGCTRESEAQRRGKWILLTNAKDRTVSFRVGLDGSIPLPGHIIGIADELLAGAKIGGRISQVSERAITLDRDARVKVGDRLVLNLPSGKSEARTIQSIAGRVVTVTTAYSETPRAELVWSVDADDLAGQQYRVMGIARPESGVFEISAVQHDPDKYQAIDTGVRLEDRPISVLPASSQAAPTNVKVQSFTQVDQGIAINTMTIAWDAAANAVAYEMEWRKDAGNWIRLPRTGALSVDVTGIYSGQYIARVRAFNVMDAGSLWANSALTPLEGKTGEPPAVAFLQARGEIFSIVLDWGFPAGAEDTQRTEIWYSRSPTLDSAIKLGDFAYPQNTHTLMGLGAGETLYFWARLVDRSGNVGGWSAMAAGQSSSDANAILDYLGGQIGRTELAGELLKPIEDAERVVDIAVGRINTLLEDIEVAQLMVSAERYLRDDADAEVKGEVHEVKLDLGQTKARVISVEENAATETEAVARRFEAVIATVDQNKAAIVQESVARVSADEAQATRINGLASRVTGAEANIVTVSETVARNDQATATQLSTLNAKLGQTSAALTAETQARVNNDGALSSQITTAQATANNASAAVQQTSTALANTNGKLASMYTVRTELTTNGRRIAAGIALGVESNGTEVESQFLVSANRFAVVNETNGQVNAPFVVQNGQTFIRDAFIADASIGTAKIKDLAVDTLKLAGYAVTLPEFVIGTEGVIPAGGSGTILSRYMVMPANSAGVTVMVTLSILPVNDNASAIVQVRLNGTVYGSWGYSLPSNYFTSVSTFCHLPTIEGRNLIEIVLTSPTSGPGSNVRLNYQAPTAVLIGAKR